MKLLDLCCCAGGASMGYHRAGFTVKGVDIDPQPNYPFEFVQTDCFEYLADHYQEFDAIHASVPCQKYSVTGNMYDNSHYPDLIAPMRNALIATGKPYIMENVPGSPMQNYIYLDGTMFPETLRVIRMRYFEGNILLLQPPRGKKLGYTSGRGKSYSSFDDGYYITVAGHNFRFRDGCVAMDIDWMTRNELCEAIPPVFTEFLGRQMMTYLVNSSEYI